MARNRGRDTGPELAVRRELHRLGMRYRVNFQPVPHLRRTADIAFPRSRLLVLIDGCFWHGCPAHYRPATGNSVDYWTQKIERNRQRDVESTASFEAAGWRVLRFWEHQSPSDVAQEVQQVLTRG